MSQGQNRSQEDVEQERFERGLHQQNLQRASAQDDDSEQAKILRYLSEIDDLPVDADDPVLGQLVSKLTSTANLSAEQVTSNEWVRDYLMVLYLCKHPTKEGMAESDRAWAHDDVTAYRKPLDAEKRMEIEAFITNSKIALTRSEDFRAVEEATHTVSETIVNDEGAENSSGGGIMGRLGLR